MSSCEMVQELISRMLDEELTPQEAALVEQHRKSCPDCAAAYAAFHALSSALGEDLEEPPETLRENVMAELHRSSLREIIVFRRPWRAVLSAAACILIFVGITQFLSPGLGRKSVAMSTAPRSVVTADSGALAAGEAQEAESAAADAEVMRTEEAAMNSLYAAPAPKLAESLEDACLEEAAELPVYDLSDRMALAELLELMQGEKAAPSSDAALSPAFSFLLSDGALDLYRLGEALYYYDPAGLQLMRCGCEEAALFSALGI